MCPCLTASRLKEQEDKTLRIKDTSGLHLYRVRPSHSFTPRRRFPPPRGAWLVGGRCFAAGGSPQNVISWQARVLEMKCRFRGAGGLGGVGGGGAAPPPAADHSHVKQVHVECKENKERDCAGRTISTRCLVCCFVACFGSCSCWLFVVALAECACMGWLVGWLVEKVFCRRGFTLKCDFVAGAGVGDEVQISWVSRPQPRKTSAC